MGAYNWIARNLIMGPAMAAAGRPVFKYLEELESSQWWSRERLFELQSQRLEQLLSYAYEHVPYYRSRIQQSGLDLEELGDPTNLTKLPITTKADIRDNAEALKSDEFARMKKFYHSSGGSTGDPIQHWFDIRTWSMRHAARYRGWGMAGYQVGDAVISIGGASLHPRQKKNPQAVLHHYIERNHVVSGIELSDPILEQRTQLLLRKRAKFLYGYASSLYLWADYLVRHKIEIDSVRGIFPTSETLYPHYRETIERAFGCGVFDSYGARDGGISAFQCDEHDGYHLSIESCVFEVIDPQTGMPTDGLGDLIVTDLFNFCMPMIRYKVGDIGRLARHSCRCGRGLPLLAELAGRSADIFYFDNGRVLTAPGITLLFKDLGFIKYQVRQVDGKTILVRVVKGKDETGTDMQTVRSVLHHHVGDDVQVRFEFVDDIALPPSGKRPFFIAEPVHH